MKSVFITGANKGIGFETAKQLLQQGYYVYLGSRNLDNGQKAVQQLNELGLEQVEAIEIDVTNNDSVTAACHTIEEKTDVLDVLINNAGISGGMPQTACESSVEDQFKKVYETNVFGVVRVTQAFLKLLKNAKEPRIVMPGIDYPA